MRDNRERKPMERHGLSNTKLYHRWTAIVSRVTDPANACYRNYGGRGIKICDEWRDFLNFRDWAYNSGYDPELVIDRIDVNGNYCPENCRWVTKSESSINRRKTDKYAIQRQGNRYQVTVVRNGYHFYLGTFADANTAQGARNEFLKYYRRGELDDCWLIKSVKRYVA